MHEILHQNDLRDLITALRTKYAGQFNKNFEGKNAVPMATVEAEAAKNLIGVTPAQFRRGLALLYTSINRFMPSFAEFREMCIGEDWWNPEKAWVKACEYTKLTKPKPIQLEDGTKQYRDITTLAKFALDQVKSTIQDGEMYRAKDEFIRLYQAYVAEAQIKGRKQDWYQESPALETKADSRIHTPVSNSIAQKQLENLKAKLNVRNRTVAKPQKLESKKQPKQLENFWPDPFENPKEYLKACDHDGVKVPGVIRRQLGDEA